MALERLSNGMTEVMSSLPHWNKFLSNKDYLSIQDKSEHIIKIIAYFVDALLMH